jgi:hypothetical protein
MGFRWKLFLNTDNPWGMTSRKPGSLLTEGCNEGVANSEHFHNWPLITASVALWIAVTHAVCSHAVGETHRVNHAHVCLSVCLSVGSSILSLPDRQLFSPTPMYVPADCYDSECSVSVLFVQFILRLVGISGLIWLKIGTSRGLSWTR